MSHRPHRPTPAKRIFADMHYPTRESDGDEWHVGTLTDLRTAHINTAREAARANLERARAARERGEVDSWGFYMARAAGWREQFAGLVRSGGPINN